MHVKMTLRTCEMGYTQVKSISRKWKSHFYLRKTSSQGREIVYTQVKTAFQSCEMAFTSVKVILRFAT